MGLEAQRLINVSIGKINQSRVTRTGTSLHKSLLVASVLQKARNVYLDEEREKALRYSQCPQVHTISSQITVTPVSPPIPHNPPTIETVPNPTQISDYSDEHNVATAEENISRLPLSDANTGNELTPTTTTTTTVTSISNSSTTTTTSISSSNKKRRRVSEQETEAAIKSILPKRIRTEETHSEEPDETPQVDSPESPPPAQEEDQ